MKNQILEHFAKQIGYAGSIENMSVDRITRPHLITLVEEQEKICQGRLRMCRENNHPLSWLDGHEVTFGDIAAFFAEEEGVITGLLKAKVERKGVTDEKLRELFAELLDNPPADSKELNAVKIRSAKYKFLGWEDNMYFLEDSSGLTLPAVLEDVIDEETTFGQLLKVFK